MDAKAMKNLLCKVIVELNDQSVTMSARESATVVLLRDAADGMEVFMVKRHGLSDVLGALGRTG